MPGDYYLQPPHVWPPAVPLYWPEPHCEPEKFIHVRPVLLDRNLAAVPPLKVPLKYVVLVLLRCYACGTAWTEEHPQPQPAHENAIAG